LDGTELVSSVVVLLAIVLVLDRTTLLPSEDGLLFDVVGFQVLDVIGLTYGLDQRIHLVWELGNEDHGLEMRRDGTFGCCHPGEADEDGVNGESGIGVSRDDDIHRHLEFFVCHGDPGFAIGSLEIFPGYGSEHGGDVGVLFDGLLEKI